jgi:ELWxxDGT repeat protein
MMKRAALLLLLAAPWIAAAPVRAGQASLIADLAPGPAGSAGAGSAPRQLVTVSGRTLFFTGAWNSGNGEDPGVKLWGTDGTESGTDLLAVLCSPPLNCVYGPAMLGSLDGPPGIALALFQVDTGDGSYTVRLWRTDGTRSGTYPIAGPFLYMSSGLVRFGGLHYFMACAPNTGCSLWHTDGTATGTAPGRQAGSGSIAVLKGRMFYLSSGSRAALWSTDGTAEGTRLVHGLPEGQAWQLTVAGSRLYFTAGPSGKELWTSDGTKTGTRFVKTFGESDDDGFGGTWFLQPWGERILFVANPPYYYVSNLWVSDGTAKGTRRLTRFSGFEVGGLQASRVAILRDRVFFVAAGVSGPRLWSTRGTPATTAPVTGCPGGCPALHAYAPLVPLGTRLLLPGIDGLRITDGVNGGGPSTVRLHTGPVDALAPAGGLVYFASGDRLWRTDGTVTGTVPLGGIEVAPPWYGRIDLAPLGARAVFAGSDPVHGAQPWITDGTPDGTTLLANLGGAAASSMPADFTSLGTALGGRLLFTAEDGSTRSVWSSDGTAAGTLALAGADLDSPPPAGLVRAGGLGYFTRDEGTRFDLWRTDGTAAGTFVVAEFPDRAIRRLSEVGGRLVALVSSTLGEKPVHALWTSDGTPAGTRKIVDLPEDTVETGSWIPLGPELFFTAAHDNSLGHLDGRQDVYRSDGTPEGTRAILQLGCGGCTLDQNPIEAVRGGDGKAVLLAWGLNDFGRNLWRTDGTPEGTEALLSLPDDGSGRIYFPTAPAALGNDILFFASSAVDDFTRWTLWRLRGSDLTLLTSAGSASYDLETLSSPVDDGHGHLVFSAWDPDHGRELWRTDGTPGGTVLVADILPGPTSSSPEGLTFAGGQLVFSAQDGIHGRELWTTDGTAAGTRLLEDLAPGGVSSSPRGFTAAGDRLFFSADDGITGREPWVRPLPF